MTKNSDNDMAPPIVLFNTSTLKSSRKPKSIIWRNHIKQGKQISKGHWSATCNYCNQFWYKGSPAALEEHLGNSCKNVPLDVRDLFLNWLTAKVLEVERIKDINRALVKAFVVCGIPFHIIENLFFIELLKTLRPAFEPPSNNIFSGRYLAQETAFANQTIIKKLNGSKNLTIACDGWSNPSNDSIWNFELLAEKIANVLENIGPEKFSAVVTDSGANIKAARHIIAEQYLNILNLRCISHAVNLISRDICKTPFANRMLMHCNTVVSYFKRNHFAGGLKRWVDTHWHTMYDCVFLIIRHKVPLEI
ncbi:4448_t:CDS:2, partial [Gigaspora margarita]